MCPSNWSPDWPFCVGLTFNSGHYWKMSITQEIYLFHWLKLRVTRYIVIQLQTFSYPNTMLALSKTWVLGLALSWDKYKMAVAQLWPTMTDNLKIMTEVREWLWSVSKQLGLRRIKLSVPFFKVTRTPKGSQHSVRTSFFVWNSIKILFGLL